MPEIKITEGLRFRSTNFQMDAQILSVHPDKNVAKVMLTAKDGHDWTEDWNLEHTRWGFERCEYFPVDSPSIPVKEGQDEMKEAIEFYLNGVGHFFKCINWGKSFLDAEAIQFMNDHEIKFKKALQTAKTIKP